MGSGETVTPPRHLEMVWKCTLTKPVQSRYLPAAPTSTIVANRPASEQSTKRGAWPASRGEVTIFRQPWRDGKTIGAPQVALKVPFAFPLVVDNANAYDFSRDLSTIVYARPGGHADLYLLSQK